MGGGLYFAIISRFQPYRYFGHAIAILAGRYDKKHDPGDIQGGPMYIIREGLGSRWHWLATMFAAAALIGTLPVVQVNQLTQVMRDVVFMPAGLANPDAPFVFNFLFGLFAAALVASVIFGGVKRLGYVTARLVPFMVGLYLLMTFFVRIRHLPELPSHLMFIVSDAFSGQAVAGGLAGVIAFVVLIFASSTMFTFWYCAAKSLGFLIGAERQDSYKYYYMGLVVIGAIIPLEAVFAIIDSGFALMPIPTMTATLLLSGKVTAAAREYFKRHA